jgi:hypothetical protein
MDNVDRLLLILHFLGLGMGLSVGFSSMVMGALMGKSTPADQAVLARFPPAMSRVGDIGLATLWITGLTLLFSKWGGFGVMPWTFHVKLTAVVILTALIGYIHTLMRKARNGDAAAMKQIPLVGRVAFLMAVTAVVFAVATFD